MNVNKSFALDMRYDHAEKSYIIFKYSWLCNSLKVDDTFIGQEMRSSLVQVMACHLLGAKPSPEPIIV